MTHLFESAGALRLPVADGELLLWRRVDFGSEQGVLERLIDETPWRLEQVRVWGKTYPQPRLTAWYGDGSQSYSYSGITLSALPWTPTLLELKSTVEAVSGSSFNSALLNYYRDQRDSMGLHSDDEPELGDCPTIASVTFGEVRQFVMKHKYRREIEDVKLRLPSGSLLVMKGATQANWKHGIPRQSKPCGPRVNLTFRRIVG